MTFDQVMPALRNGKHARRKDAVGGLAIENGGFVYYNMGRREPVSILHKDWLLASDWEIIQKERSLVLMDKAITRAPNYGRGGTIISAIELEMLPIELHTFDITFKWKE